MLLSLSGLYPLIYFIPISHAQQAKSVVVDMAFVLEGKREEELPEVLIGAVRLKNVDFKNCDGQRLCST